MNWRFYHLSYSDVPVRVGNSIWRSSNGENESKRGCQGDWQHQIDRIDARLDGHLCQYRYHDGGGRHVAGELSDQCGHQGHDQNNCKWRKILESYESLSNRIRQLGSLLKE